MNKPTLTAYNGKKNTAKLFTQKVLGSTVSLKPWTNMLVRRKLWKVFFDRCTQKIILKQGPCVGMTRFSNTVQIYNFFPNLP